MVVNGDQSESTQELCFNKLGDKGAEKARWMLLLMDVEGNYFRVHFCFWRWSREGFTAL
jgi:hypothetical protein